MDCDVLDMTPEMIEALEQSQILITWKLLLKTTRIRYLVHAGDWVVIPVVIPVVAG